jgi:hypothetical protein
MFFSYDKSDLCAIFMENKNPLVNGTLTSENHPLEVIVCHPGLARYLEQGNGFLSR